ncbi:MAG TPA: hypothetical protein VHB30_00660 [Solirubrobacteraceae bacterium]|nr:hypothetical protein [Solirubrobacteraceae bacterium]
MGKHIFLALTNPTPGREKDFNDWYDNHHLREVVTYLPGFVSGQRYRLAENQRSGESPPWRYLACYQVETDDLVGFHEAQFEVFRSQPGLLTRDGGACDPDHAAWVYTPIGEEALRPAPEGG